MHGQGTLPGLRSFRNIRSGAGVLQVLGRRSIFSGGRVRLETGPDFDQNLTRCAALG